MTSLLILMNTSLVGSVFGMEAFKYALPMSMVVTSLPSLAAICATRNIAVVDTVGEEVSDAGYFPLS